MRRVAWRAIAALSLFVLAARSQCAEQDTCEACLTNVNDTCGWDPIGGGSCRMNPTGSNYITDIGQCYCAEYATCSTCVTLSDSVHDCAWCNGRCISHGSGPDCDRDVLDCNASVETAANIASWIIAVIVISVIVGLALPIIIVIIICCCCVGASAIAAAKGRTAGEEGGVVHLPPPAVVVPGQIYAPDYGHRAAYPPPPAYPTYISPEQGGY